MPEIEARTSLSDFMRGAALEAAELALIERPEVVIPEGHWDAFEADARAPVRRIPALADLARTPPSWEE